MKKRCKFEWQRLFIWDVSNEKNFQFPKFNRRQEMKRFRILWRAFLNSFGEKEETNQLFFPPSACCFVQHALWNLDCQEDKSKPEEEEEEEEDEEGLEEEKRDEKGGDSELEMNFQSSTQNSVQSRELLQRPSAIKDGPRCCLETAEGWEEPFPRRIVNNPSPVENYNTDGRSPTGKGETRLNITWKQDDHYEPHFWWLHSFHVFHFGGEEGRNDEGVHSNIYIILNWPPVRPFLFCRIVADPLPRRSLVVGPKRGAKLLRCRMECFYIQIDCGTNHFQFIWWMLWWLGWGGGRTTEGGGRAMLR